MRFNALRHIRDHSKTTGLPRLLLYEIGTHLNYHTGEAFLLSVDRLAHQLGVTPQWTRRLLSTLIASGELVVAPSRGRHPNVYRIPYERCHACQATQPPPSTPPETNPKLEFRVDVDPDQTNPKLDTHQPETPSTSTRNSEPFNPKLEGASQGLPARIGPPKDVYKERKICKDSPDSLARERQPWASPDRWQGKKCARDGCTRRQCPHWQQCREHACCECCAAVAPGQS